MRPIGPFASEAEARAAAHEIVPPDPGHSILSPGQNVHVLTRACEDAGVELGSYDRTILAWLAGFTDAYAGVFAGTISRAYEAGKRQGEH